MPSAGWAASGVALNQDLKCWAMWAPSLIGFRLRTGCLFANAPRTTSLQASRAALRFPLQPRRRISSSRVSLRPRCSGATDHRCSCSMLPRRLAVTRCVTPSREGGSMPAFVETDDRRLYVLKFRGDGQGNEDGLASGEFRPECLRGCQVRCPCCAGRPSSTLSRLSADNAVLVLSLFIASVFKRVRVQSRWRTDGLSVPPGAARSGWCPVCPALRAAAAPAGLPPTAGRSPQSSRTGRPQW
jgi:hypothetical protein